MAKIREDLVGITIIRDDSGLDHILHPGDTVPAGLTVGEHLLGDATPESGKSADSKVPPKGGPGSGAPAWRAYALEAATAAGLNIDIPEDADRGDIIDALTTAGIPTE